MNGDVINNTNEATSVPGNTTKPVDDLLVALKSISLNLKHITNEIEQGNAQKDIEEIRRIIVKRIDKFCFLVIFLVTLIMIFINHIQLINQYPDTSPYI